MGIPFACIDCTDKLKEPYVRLQCGHFVCKTDLRKFKDKLPPNSEPATFYQCRLCRKKQYYRRLKDVNTFLGDIFLTCHCCEFVKDIPSLWEVTIGTIEEEIKSINLHCAKQHNISWEEARLIESPEVYAKISNCFGIISHSSTSPFTRINIRLFELIYINRQSKTWK